MNTVKPIYEFLVWDNCNNNCKFCFQRENPRLYNHQKRKEILDEVLNFINSDKFKRGSHILICGGEVFDKPNDLLQLKYFFTEILNLMINNVVDLLYINTNLIYKNLDSLNFLLKNIKVNNLFNRLKFTTSYDLEGRFKTEESRKLMLNNLSWIKTKYPECNIVSNIILTKSICEAIISKKFSVKQFMDKYQCWVNLIPYIIFDESLIPSREQIFKTLQIVGSECAGYLEKYVHNISLKQEKWLYMYKDNKFKFCSCDLSDCGHSINFKKYSKKNTCFCCDLKRVFKNG